MPKNAQTNSQQVYEKMLNITLHQENGNQHQNEVSPHTHLNNIIKKKKTRYRVLVKMWSSLNSCTLLVEIYNGNITMENNMEIPQELK